MRPNIHQGQFRVAAFLPFLARLKTKKHYSPIDVPGSLEMAVFLTLKCPGDFASLRLKHSTKMTWANFTFFLAGKYRRPAALALDGSLGLMVYDVFQL
jgi:hypothetical protein